jgi:hypothetical protein
MGRSLLPLTLSLLLSLALAGCGNGSDTDAGGSAPYPGLPGSSNPQGERNLAILIRGALQGRVKTTPWAGSWFPYSSGGISQAASKYEGATGQAGAVSWEQEHHGPGLPGIQDWWGHCNGWAAAAALVPEPRKDASRQGVNFGVGDQKALFTEIAMEVSAEFFGTRYDTGGTSSAAFQDVYPNQFFLVMTNYIGRGFPVLLDRYTGSQVWNQPLAGYQTDAPSPQDYLGASPGAPNVYRLNLTTRIWWVRDDVEPGHLTEAFDFKDGPSYESRVLRYEVWLDGPVQFGSDGQISQAGNLILPREGNTVTGGVWRNGNLELNNSHPDYMWVPKAFAPSTGFANPRIDANWVRGFSG